MYGMCPICDKPTMVESVGYFGITRCKTCPYELRQQGSYATLSIIDGQRFSCEDGYGDEKKRDKKIKEMRLAIGNSENPLPQSVLQEILKKHQLDLIEKLLEKHSDNNTE